MELPIVNHPDYVAKINDDNKFPIKKFGALAENLLRSKIVKNFYIPKECSVNTMKTSHSLEYINHIKNKTLDSKLQKKPLQCRVPKPLLRAPSDRGQDATPQTQPLPNRAE